MKLKPLVTKEIMIMLMDMAANQLLTMPEDELLAEVKKLSKFDRIAVFAAASDNTSFNKGLLQGMFMLGWISAQLLQEFVDSQVSMN